MCHSYSLFPFYTPLSLPSLLSFSYVPALFFSLSLRYANCARNASRLSTNCKWQGLIRFVSQCLGHFTLPTSVTRCVRVWNFLYSLFCLFFFYLLPLSLSLFLFLFSLCVRLRWYALLIWRDQRSFLSSRRVALYLVLRGLCAISSRLLFLFRSFPISILGSTMRVTSNRNAATTKSSIGRICTACTVCIWRGNSSRYYGIVLLLFCNRCTMALCNEESIRCIVERRCMHTLPKGAFLLVDASRNRSALILLILYCREICNFL